MSFDFHRAWKFCRWSPLFAFRIPVSALLIAVFATLMAMLTIDGFGCQHLFAEDPHPVLKLVAMDHRAANLSTAAESSTAGVGAAKAAPLKIPGAAGIVAAGIARTVTTEVQVRAGAEATDSNEGYERRITTQEVEQSAGTFGDPGRFMQMLPGVVSDNDERNDFIVRGGNPSETLFVIDNIELPSINQLALSDTTGGFVSMVDNAAVQHTTLHTDAYDSKFDQRLSAVVEMSTRPEAPVKYHVNTEFGIGGTGSSMERPLGTDGSLFLSLRRSILNWFTDNIGMNGVPIYTNGLVRADRRIDAKNNWWGLSLTGIDSIVIHPSPTDAWETNPFDIFYNGWRNTTGINWQHIFSPRSFGVLSVSNSEQQQTVKEDAQLLDNAQVYYENSHDGITTLKYDWTLATPYHFTWAMGGRAGLDRLNYDVQQPIGVPNPYSVDPTPGSPMSLDRSFTPASSAVYGQATIQLPLRAKAVVGERVTEWAIAGSSAATGKVVLSAPVLGRMFHVGYAQYAQLPPNLYLLAYQNQHALGPIRSRQLTAGVVIAEARRVRLVVNGYQKLYSDYPVSVTFPQLSLANIADTFGQAFLMFPMTSQGQGIARGIEASGDWLPIRRVSIAGALTYMRSWYSGLDGVMRKGNFDMPVVGNLSGNVILSKHWTASFRYSGSTGRPYTPDNQALSIAEDRDVYDLTQINAQRGPTYSRLDFRWEWSHPMRHGLLTTHFGLENAMNTPNYYKAEWRSRCQIAFNQVCGTLEQDQMPMFPDAGLRITY